MGCDTLGRPVRFLLAAGQSHDILAVPALLEGQKPKAVLADRAYDANGLRQHLEVRRSGNMGQVRGAWR